MAIVTTTTGVLTIYLLAQGRNGHECLQKQICLWWSWLIISVAEITQMFSVSFQSAVTPLPHLFMSLLKLPAVSGSFYAHLHLNTRSLTLPFSHHIRIFYHFPHYRSTTLNTFSPSLNIPPHSNIISKHFPSLKRMFSGGFANREGVFQILPDLLRLGAGVNSSDNGNYGKS